MLNSPVRRFESFWAQLITRYGPYRVEFYGTGIVQILFWLPSAMYLALPHVAPDFSERHKIQPAPRQPTASDIRHCLLYVIRNEIITRALGLAGTLAASASGRPPVFRVDPALPTPGQFLRDLTICILLREILFYYSHRLLHTPSLYRTIHKTHHKFVAPVALAAQYAHPVEHLVANVLPIALPPALLGAHVLTAWAFIASQLLETATVHSGYDFWRGAARRHDAHHERFVVNFGAVGLMDWVHGTDGKRRAKARGRKKRM